MVQPAEHPAGGVIRRLFHRIGLHVEPAAVEASVVAVASGKGGTGKSFVATSLAIALSRRGKVVLVDCDYGLGNDHLLLGTSTPHTLRDVIAGRVRAADALVQTDYGPRLLAGGSGVSSMVELADSELATLADALSALARSADQVVLDLGAGISPQLVLTLLASDQVVLVTNPDLAALTDAYALIKCLARQRVHPPIGVIVNRVAGAESDLGPRTFAKLADVAARFCSYPLHYLGEIPDDPAIAQRRLGQAPLITSHPQCAVAVAIEQISRRLEETSGGLRPHPVSGSAALAQRWKELIPRRRLRD